MYDRTISPSPTMPEQKKRIKRTDPNYALEVHERYLVIKFDGDLNANVIAQTTDEIHSDRPFES